MVNIRVAINVKTYDTSVKDDGARERLRGLKLKTPVPAGARVCRKTPI